MPPKAKGKAAAKAKVKARAKAAPKFLARPAAAPGALGLAGAGGLGRGRRLRVRRKPAADVGEAATPAVEGVIELDVEKLAIEDLLGSGLLVIEGLYWEAPVVIAGRGEGLDTEDSGRYLVLQVEGTKSEVILHNLSGKRQKRLRVHLCGKTCEHRVWKEDVVHLVKVRKWEKEAEAWMSNMKDVRMERGNAPEEDELQALREEAREVTPPGREKKKKRKKSRSKSPKTGKDRKKEEKKEKKKASSKSVRVKAKKGLEEVLGNTGLDPDPDIRRKLIKKARKLAEGKKTKKKKKSKKDEKASSGEEGAESEDSDSEESTTTEEKGLEQEELFGSVTSVKRISQEYPGVLTSSWIGDCQQYLLDAHGQIWNKEEGPVQPLAVAFYRNQMHGRMSGPMGREYLTIAYMIDLALQGRTAESIDIGAQRLKSLMSTHTGIHFSIAQKLEIVPAERTLPASLTETQEAARAAREEERVLQRAARPARWQNNYPPDAPKGGKGKDGKGKKGKDKGKNKEGDKVSGGEPKR